MASKEYDDTVKATDEQKARVKKLHDGEKEAYTKRNQKYKFFRTITNKDVVARCAGRRAALKKFRIEMKEVQSGKSRVVIMYFKDKSGQKVSQQIEKSSAFPSVKHAVSLNEKQRKRVHDKVYKAEKDLFNSRKVSVSSTQLKLSLERQKQREARSSKFREFRQKNKGQFKRKHLEIHLKGQDGKKAVENGWSIPSCHYPRSSLYVQKVFNKFDKQKIGYVGTKHLKALPTALGIPSSKFADFEKHCVTEKRIYEAKVLEFVQKLCEAAKPKTHKAHERSQTMPCQRQTARTGLIVDVKSNVVALKKKLGKSRIARLKDMKVKKDKLAEEKEDKVLLTITYKGSKYNYDLTDYKPCEVSEHQLHHLGKMWQTSEKEGSGIMTEKEFKAFLDYMGVVDPKSKLFGLSNSGIVSYSDFLQFWYCTEHKSANVDGTKTDKYAANKKKHDAVKQLKRKVQPSQSSSQADNTKYKRRRTEFRKARADGRKKYAKVDPDSLTIYCSDDVGTKSTVTFKYSKNSVQNILAHQQLSKKQGYFVNTWDSLDWHGAGVISQAKFSQLCSDLGVPAKPKNCCNRKVVNLYEAANWWVTESSCPYVAKVDKAKRSKVLERKQVQKSQSEKRDNMYKLCSDEEVLKQRSSSKQKWAAHNEKMRALRKQKHAELWQKKGAKAHEQRHTMAYVCWVKAPTKSMPKKKITAVYSTPKQSSRSIIGISSAQQSQVKKVLYQSGNETGLYTFEELGSYFGSNKVLADGEFKQLQDHFKGCKVITEEDIVAWWLAVFSNTPSTQPQSPRNWAESKTLSVPHSPLSKKNSQRSTARQTPLGSPGKQKKKLSYKLPTPTKRSPGYLQRKDILSLRDKFQANTEKKLEESRAARQALKSQLKKNINNMPIVQLFLPKQVESMS